MSFVEGTVVAIVYRNEENGYTVLELDSGGKLVTCVGNLPMVQPGETVRFYGAMTVHRNYGEQFKVVSMESKLPEQDESIALFLSGGLISGVGEVLARRIVEEFHEETFDIIENRPERLADVKGISKAAALRISAQYRELATVRTTVMELQKLGLTMREAMAAYETYGRAAAYIVQQNPYRLMDDVRGIGFEKADRIAAGMQLENYEDLRLLSGIRHVLRRQMEAGHTCLPLERLERLAAEMLQESEERTHLALTRLIADGALCESVYNGVRAVATVPAYEAETYCAEKLVRLSRAALATEHSHAVADEVLTASPLSEEQERAVLMALNNSVCVITGGPGTGKTTILNQLIAILEKSGVSAQLAAPTGRAAKRMEKATLRPARTIHRLLEYGAVPGDDIESDYSRFARDEDNPIEADTVIIDEMSMVDIFLLRSLLAAVRPGTRLILTGDADQLPSVGPGNVLRDIIASGQLPVATLTEVFRQRGNIALNAARVRDGEGVELFTAGDFVFHPCAGVEETMEVVRRLYAQCAGENADPDAVQIICPVKKGQIGVYNLNKLIREDQNPRQVKKAEIAYGDTVFREGDKVMQTANNYGKEWYLRGASRVLSHGSGVYNGDIGRIERIDPEEREIDILFDGERLATYELREMDQVEHAYAVTVHKSQGSEYDTVILPLFYGMNDFLTRNLFYTAITRAKTKLYLVGSRRTAEFMAANRKVAHRFTALNYLIEENARFMSGLASRGGSLELEYEPFPEIFTNEEEGE